VLNQSGGKGNSVLEHLNKALNGHSRENQKGHFDRKAISRMKSVKDSVKKGVRHDEYERGDLNRRVRDKILRLLDQTQISRIKDREASISNRT
jgi:hypothetical protein